MCVCVCIVYIVCANCLFMCVVCGVLLHYLGLHLGGSPWVFLGLDEEAELGVGEAVLAWGGDLEV